MVQAELAAWIGDGVNATWAEFELVEARLAGAFLAAEQAAAGQGERNRQQ